MTEENNTPPIFDVITLWIFGAVVFCTVLLLSSIVSAYVLSQLWSWYIVPFFGLKALPLPYAFGFIVIVSFIMPKVHVEDKRSTVEKISFSVATPIVAYLLGWIGTLFIA